MPHHFNKEDIAHMQQSNFQLKEGGLWKASEIQVIIEDKLYSKKSKKLNILFSLSMTF